MSVTLYHNPRCSKSRETLKLLQDRGISPTIIEYLKTPPSVAELTKILSLLGLNAGQILRKKETAEAGLDPASLSEAELIAAIVAHPATLERPIVLANGKAALGRPPENVLAIL